MNDLLANSFAPSANPGLSNNSGLSTNTATNTALTTQNLVENQRVMAQLEQNPSLSHILSNPAQRVMVENIIAGISPNTNPNRSAELLAGVLTRTMPNGTPMINTVHDGQTFLQNLNALATTQSLAEGIETRGITRAAILRSALETFADRGSINQHLFCTCGNTSIEHSLVDHDPARLLSTVSQLAINGRANLETGTMTLAPNLDINGTRGVFSSIYQDSLSHSIEPGSRDAGCSNASLERMFELATGRAAVAIPGTNRGQLQSAISNSLDTNQPLICTLVGFGTGPHSQHVIRPVSYDSIQSRIPRDIANNQSEYVFFYNPHGSAFAREGLGGARLIDANQSLYCLPRREFMERTVLAVVPTDRAADLGPTASIDNFRSIRANYSADLTPEQPARNVLFVLAPEKYITTSVVETFSSAQGNIDQELSDARRAIESQQTDSMQGGGDRPVEQRRRRIDNNGEETLI